MAGPGQVLTPTLAATRAWSPPAGARAGATPAALQLLVSQGAFQQALRALVPQLEPPTRAPPAPVPEPIPENVGEQLATLRQVLLANPEGHLALAATVGYTAGFTGAVPDPGSLPEMPKANVRAS